MNWGRFITLDAFRHIVSNRRWLLPFPLMLLVTCLETATIINRADTTSVKANAWDVVFSLLGNHFLLFLVMNPLFIYLICGLLPEDSFGESMVLRLTSRSHWWVGKLMTLVLSLLCYLAMFVVTIAVVTSFVLPWAQQWSEGAERFPTAYYLNPSIIERSPFVAALQLICLLSLGWLCLGLTALTTIQHYQRSIGGFLAGVLINLSGLAASRADVPYPYSLLFIDQHLLLNQQAFGNASSMSSSLTVSITYWLIWVLLLFGLGWRFSNQINFAHLGD